MSNDRRGSGSSASTQPKSYSSTRYGLRGRLAECVNLYRRQARNIPNQVTTLIERLRQAERDVQSVGGRAFEGLRVLEIGPGQKLRQTKFFARRNDVVAIDIDELVQGGGLASYWRMLRANGPVRNFDPWYKAFDVKPGDALYIAPDQRVRIW